MATTMWDSAGLLKLLKLNMGLQDANEMDDTTDLYPRLARAQRSVIQYIALRCVKALYQQPTALTRASDGKTFSFGTDAQSDPIVPIGEIQIATSLAAFSGDYFSGWQEGVHYLGEGDHIRIPGGRSRSGVLYGRWVNPPPDISASVQPILLPVEARELIPIQAAWDWALEGNQAPKIAVAMAGQMATKRPGHMLAYKTRFKGGGALMEPGLWYLSSPDLAGQSS